MDGIAGPTQAPLDTAAPAESAATPTRAESPTRLWAWPKMHQLLFVAFTLVRGVPIAVLAIWEGQTAFQNELDSVRERHLLVARNLTSTMSRYVKDLKAAFPLAFAQGSMSQPPTRPGQSAGGARGYPHLHSEPVTAPIDSDVPGI